jgi:SpoVK/Ycf46/Vps4 family AAA+-type ATPase
MPNQLINSLTDPNFLPLMTDHPGSVLVIEDAEEALRSRKNGGVTVDKLLNIADGIISDFLGIQIICTFNSSVSMLDEALLRKGRLILKHEFKKLDIEASQKLIDKLGLNYKATKPMTLAEIYNIEDTYSEGAKADDRKPIGFGAV